MAENDLKQHYDDLWQKGITLLRDVMSTEQERSQMERYVPLITFHEIEGNEYVV